jgi:hypothetical protein
MLIFELKIDRFPEMALKDACMQGITAATVRIDSLIKKGLRPILSSNNPGVCPVRLVRIDSLIKKGLRPGFLAAFLSAFASLGKN